MDQVFVSAFADGEFDEDRDTDGELSCLVRERDEARANDIATSCLRTFTDYTEDVGAFAAAHRRLLEAASGGAVE